MSTPDRPAAPESDLATLVRRLAEAEAALQSALAGQVDAIVDAEGHPLLLHDAQRTLISSEATQRRAAEMQAAILNALPAHIALVDQTGTILAVNESWRLFASANGMASGAFGIGQNYLAVCDTADGPCADEAPSAARGLRRVLAGETKAFSLEYPCHSPTEQRWFRLMITPVLSDRLTGAVVMHIDITERRLAENALRTSEANMAAAQRIGHFGSWELELADPADPDANPLRWSDEMFRIAGFEPGAVPVTNALFFSLVPPGEHAAIRAAVAAAIRDRRTYSIVHRLVRPDGTERVVQETAQIFSDETSGRPLRMVGTTHDITEQRRTQEAIRRQAHMLDHIGQAVIATDPEGRIVYSNRHATELYGWTTEEMLGRDIVAVTVPSVSREQATAIIERLRNGETWHGEFEVRDRAGRVFPALITDAPLLDADGRLVGIVGVSTDIGARKAAEDAARRSAEEQRVLAAQLAGERARLVAAQAVAKVGSWETDLATLEVVWSEQTFRIFETDPAAFRPTHGAFLAFVHPDDRATVDEAFRRSLAQPGAHTVEHRVLFGDGRIKFVEERWQVFADAAGQPCRAVGTCQDITERKHIEEELRVRAEQLHTSEAQYRLLFADNPLPMWVYDAETLRYLAVNAAAVRHYGYTEQEFLGMTIADIRTPEEADALHGYLRQIPPAGTRARLARHRRKDGTFVDVEITSDRIDFAGRTARLVLSHDITERVRAEREAALANRALQMLNRGNEALVRARDESALLDEICRTVVEVGGFRFAWVGYAEPDGGKRVAPQAHAGHEAGYLKEIAVSWAENAPTGRGPIARAIRGGRTVTVPDVTAPEAGFVSLEAAAARGYRGIVCLPLTDQGRSFGVLSLYLAEIRTPPADELGLLEKLAGNLAFGILARRARAKQREQAALIDASHDAIMVRDLDHRIVFWSQGAERLFGWTAAEATGATSDSLLKTDPAKFREADAAVRAHGIWNGELRKATRDGTVLTVDARWTLLRDAQDRPRSILTFDTDITERKKLEQQFLRAQRMESIGTLAGGIAHDLNNVLAPIVMGVDLLREFTADESSLQILQNIERSARRGSDLVKQVLSFARGVEGARVAVFLGHIVREVEGIAHNSFPKNIALESAVPKDLWLVTGDPTQLNQVLLNLCVNARDAMPDGGRIAITARNTTVDAQYATLNRGVASGRYVCLEVTDTGCGMPKAVLDRIFEPFFTTKELGKGTGLGLSTVLGIVRSHGGFVNVYSEVGKGSVFKVYLPAQTEGNAADAPGAAEAAALPRGHGELILVVDDEASVRDITRQTLEAFGYRVVTAEDGAQAIGLYALHRGSVGVVLTDMMMPVMDGPALIAALKRIDPAIRIVAASGLNANGNVAKAAGVGVKHFLAKPYTVEALLTTIGTVLTETPA